MAEARGSRARRSGQVARRPIVTPSAGLAPNTGPLATASWLLTRGLVPDASKWNAHLMLVTPSGDASFHLELFSDEWGYKFEHADKVSWIRVTDVPFIHGRDDHQLIRITPALKNIGRLVQDLEQRFTIKFGRDTAAIKTTLRDAEPAIRDWIRSL